ncbi:hypothetical protein FSP39_000386 [Pinctada imbricata]|uniref:Uncharacterized protein n=1 Tax=Pinctada imbricata TaxID=66713 RepID=A0AA88Y929_PINIB|nr:hypothetical protein FSP39_000386 [Pinctada imbricata]
MWNIEGLTSDKINSQSFIDSISKFNIISLVETWANDTEHNNDIPGFKLVEIRNRTKHCKARRNSGGIKVFAKSNISKGIKKMRKTHTDIVWLMLDHTFFNTNKDIYLAIVYVSPENVKSKAQNIDMIYTQLLADICEFSRLGHIILQGDFNAYTNTHPDFVVDDNSNPPCLNENVCYINDVKLPRNNLDPKYSNKSGKNLLDICKETGLRILNGRKIGDLKGNLTCFTYNGCSVVDYTIVSKEIYNLIGYFEVHEFSSLSNHCPISCSILTSYLVDKTSKLELNPLPAKFVWDNDSISKYIENINKKGNVDKFKNFTSREFHSINSAIDEFNNLLLTVARESTKVIHPKAKVKNIKKKQKNKPWFNESCRDLRISLQGYVKLVNKFPQNETYRTNYYRLKSKFRRACKKEERNYKKSVLKQINDNMSNDPKTFWNLIRNFDKVSTSHDSQYTCNKKFMDFYKELNLKDPTFNATQLNIIAQYERLLKNLQSNPDMNNTHTHLNDKISKQEIIKAIKSLKNNKSSSIDLICNEMIKTALHLACVQGHTQVVQILLEWKARSNIGDNQAKTPLIKAVECGREECVILLLQHRADISAKDSDGNTALHHAVKGGLAALVQLLIRGGANVNQKNKDGYAPLHFAIFGKKDELTRILLTQKADPDVQDSNGRTPMMLACYEGLITPVRLLLQFKANVVIKDKKGFTAEDIANMTGQHACTQLLSDHLSKLRRSTSGSSIPGTPRSSVGIPSTSTTPRAHDASLTAMLPAANKASIEHDDSDEDQTLSRQSGQDKGDDSWADDSISLGIDVKKKDDDDDMEEEEEEDNDDNKNASKNQAIFRGKQSSAKSLQSATSVEDDWSDDETSPSKNANGTPRVSFKTDDDIKVLTEEDTDVDEDENNESAAKRPKLEIKQVSEWDSDVENELDPDNPPSAREDIEIEVGDPAVDQYQDRASRYMASEDRGDFNDDRNVQSDSDDFSGTPRQEGANNRDGNLRGVGDSPIMMDYHRSQSEDVVSVSRTDEVADLDLGPSKVTEFIEDDSSRSNSSDNQRRKVEEVTQGRLDVLSRHSDDPETDQEVARVLAIDEVEQFLKSPLEDKPVIREDNLSENTMEQVPSDEEVDAYNNMMYFQHLQSQQKMPHSDEEEEEEGPVNDGEESVSPIQEATSVDPVLMASFGSGTTQQTVIEVKKKEEKEEEEDDDSDWDSDEDAGLLPSETNAPPVFMPDGERKEKSKEDHSYHTSSKGDHSITEDVEEESISEWEMDRMKEKAQKHQEDAEAERRRRIEIEADEQAEREAEIIRQQKEEAQREAELQKLKAEESKRQAEVLRMQEEAERQRLQKEAEILRLQEEQAEREAEFLRQQEWEEQQRAQEELLRREAEEESRREEEINMMPSDNSEEEPDDVGHTYDIPTSPKSPDSVSFPKRGRKSPDPKQASPQYTNDVQTPPQQTTVVEETISPVREDFIEVSTSFGVQSKTEFEDDPMEALKRDTDLHSTPKPVSEPGPSFDQNLSIGVTSFGRSPASHKTRPTPPLTTHPVMHSDGMSVDDDDSVDLDFERPDMGTFLRGLPGGSYGYGYKGLDLPDDDVLSYTSTENGDSMIYQTNSPYGKDVLANMNLSDPGAVLKLQEYMHDQNKRLDQERNQRMATENKYRSIAKEKNELTKKVDNLTRNKSNLEQVKLDMEQKIRNLEYSLNEEAEIRKNAETLLAKTKEQLSRKEEQYTSEIEAKQKAELQMRNLQIELRSATNNIKTLEDEKTDLHRQLQNEKNARQLQEQLVEDQQKFHHVLQEEQLRSSMEKNEAEQKLESADENRKAVTENLHKLKAENSAIKVELEKQRMRHREEAAMLSAENEELHNKIEELKNDIKLNEEALSHASMQYQLQLSNLRTEATVINSVLEKERASRDSNLRTEATVINSVLEKERASREKIEAELESVKTRQHASMMEVEKAEQARNDAERRLQHEHEEWSRQLENKDKEITALKDSSQALMQRLQVLDSKLTSVENELHISNTTLLDRRNQLQQAQKDLQFYKGAQENIDANYRLEKEMNNKLQSKNEQLQEKLTSVQHESLTLRQQLETTQHALLEKSGDSKAEQYNSIIASMKTDHEKSRAIWEERNTSLSDQCTRLKEENRNLESRRNQLEEDVRRREVENQENTKKMARLEAAVETHDNKKSELEAQRSQYRLEADVNKEKLDQFKVENQELKNQLTKLTTELERSIVSNEANTQKLMNNSVNMEAFSKSKGELEESYQQLKLNGAKMEAELKHEKEKSEMLHKDLQDSQKVRSSLEALCANLKSTNAHLEDKLLEDNTTKSLLTQEAEENKDMWEKEVISRSKLGLRIASYEKSKQEAFNQLEEERRKHRKSIEQKKTAETKLEAEIEKNTQLQKEVTSLKAYLKVAKKRLKAVDGQDSRLGTLHSDFERERMTMESTISSVRQQLHDLQIQLEREVEEKEKIQDKNLRLQSELNILKKVEKGCEKLKVSKAKVEEEYRLLKNKVDNGYVDKEELERVKREMEARYRLELNRKLEDVNNYLEEQARARERLDTSRDETEYKLKDERKKIQEEHTSLRIKYEQALAQIESKDMETKRYKDLYESEMQWRMRLSNQLMSQADKAFNYKSNIERQRNRTMNNLSNLTFSGTLNGQVLDVSRLSNTVDDIFQSKLKAELDRSISKHLEAAPHDSYKPVVRSTDDGALNMSYAKSNADYLETLKRKYCV